MSFDSLVYALFLPVVLLAYWQLGLRGQNRLLLAASYVFYGWWDWRFCGLLALSTMVDWAVARGLERTGVEARRRVLLSVSVLVNLGVLGFFKYFSFFMDSAERVLSSLGLEATTPTLTILLPVGISFYTFQTMAYTIDVYRRRVRAVPQLLDLALYVSFFPQLVAGPIERPGRLLPQLTSPRQVPDPAALRGAFALIVLGLVKKVVIADTMAPIVDAAHGGADTASAWMLLVGALAFALQLYGDFSGYTDIARGSARLFGIELMPNFAQPHLSRNVTEIWRTWHISLSTWLRDYLYVPLGGNRRGRWTTYRNLFVVMLLGGLWHGATWTMVLWGAGHGIWLAAHRAWSRWRGRPEVDEDDRRLLLGRRVATFAGWCALLVLFRAQSLTGALDYYRGILTLRGGVVSLEETLIVLAAAAVLLAIDLAQRRVGEDVTTYLRLPALPRAATAGAAAVALVVFSGTAEVPFIYFQF